MVTEIDISAKVQEANSRIWNGLRDYCIENDGKPPSLETATGIVEEGMKILVDAVVGEDAHVRDHVKVVLEDQSEKKDLTKVAIHMQAKSAHGATVVMLFGVDDSEDGEEFIQ